MLSPNLMNAHAETTREGKNSAAARLFRRLAPHHRYRWEIYDERLLSFLGADTIWVDAGCGGNDHVARWGEKVRFAVGVDVADHPSRTAGPFAVADLRHMPFRTGSVSLVTLRMVAEHLRHVPEDFREIDRILAPGGRLIVLTTNRWSPVIALPRLLPHALRKRILARLFGVRDDDVLPAFHRFNTPARMRRGIGRLRAESVDLLEQAPLDRPALLPLFGTWYLVSQIPLLRSLRSNMLGVFRKV